MLCTIATSMYELAAYRAIQGLGAGGLMSLALTIIGDIVPPRERARYQGFFLAVFGTSSVLGPVIGGFLAGQTTILGITGWRWVFLVNVPIGILAFLVVFRVLNLPHTRRDHRIDFPGAIALAVTLVPILIVAEQGREWGWSSASAIVCYVVAAVGLVAFLLAERAYGDDAVLPLRLFDNSVFSLTSVIAIITGIGLFGGIALVPQYLQIVTGSTPTQAGLEMLPLVGGLMVSSILSGQLTSRTGRYKIFPVIGLGLMTVGLVLFHFRLHCDTPYGEVALLMVVFGLGVGLCMQTLVLAVQNAVPAKDMGVATASATFFRQMGGTLGVAVFLSILFSTVGDNIRTAFAAAVATPAFQAAAAEPGGAGQPRQRRGAEPGDRCGPGRAGLLGAPAHGPAARRAVPRRVRQLDGPGVPRGRLRGGRRVRAHLVHAGAAAAHGLGHPGPGRGDRRRRRPRRRPRADALAVSSASSATPVSAAAAAGPDAGGRLRRDDAARLPGAHPAGRHPAAAAPRPRRPGRPRARAHARGTGDRGRRRGRRLAARPRRRPARARPGRRPRAPTPSRRRPRAPTCSSRARRGCARSPSSSRSTAARCAATSPSPAPRRCAAASPQADGTPVPGASVTVTDPGGGVVAVRRTGEDGTWETGEVEPGRYTVTVLAPGRAPAGRAGRGPRRAAPGTTWRCPRRGTRSTGAVRGAGGRPVPESLVVLVGQDGGGGGLVGHRCPTAGSGSTTSPPDGTC